MPRLVSTSEPESLLVAVDGGATGTRLRVAAADGRVLGEATGGPGSLTLRGAGAWQEILTAFTTALGDRPGEHLVRARLGLGLAGANDAALRAVFLDAAPTVGRLELATDAYIAALGAHGGAPGSIVSVGTGTVGYRILEDGGSRTVGGWGFPAGDEGSGAWLGRAAVSGALRRRDGVDRLPAGPLDVDLWQRLGADRDAILGWLRDAPSTRYATLADLVLEHAADDPIAEALVYGAAAAVGRLARALDPESRAPLALLGGLAGPLMPYFDPSLAARVVPPQGSALDGAMLLARGDAAAERF